MLLNEIYPMEKQNQYGVVGIRIDLLEEQPMIIDNIKKQN